MLRRTFAQTLLFSCSLPFWPFPQVKDRLSNSDLIKKLLKERKDFRIICRVIEDGENDGDNNGENDSMVVNIVRKKRCVDFTQAMLNRIDMTEEQKPHDTPWQPKRIQPKTRWYKFKLP